MVPDTASSREKEARRECNHLIGSCCDCGNTAGRLEGSSLGDILGEEVVEEAAEEQNNDQMVLERRISSGCELAAAGRLIHVTRLAIMRRLEAVVESEQNRPRPRRQMLVHAVIVL